MENLKELKDKARHLEPLVRIGKNGLNEAAIIEIEKLIKKRKLVKVKMLGAFLDGKDKKEIAKEMALKTNTTSIQQIGNVVVLYRK